MKQTHTHSDWYAGVIAQVRAETETLLADYKALPRAQAPAEVERAAKALLAIAKLADFADRLAQTGTSDEAQPAADDVPHMPNRQERRRLEAETKARLKAAQRLIRP